MGVIQNSVNQLLTTAGIATKLSAKQFGNDLLGVQRQQMKVDPTKAVADSYINNLGTQQAVSDELVMRKKAMAKLRELGQAKLDQGDDFKQFKESLSIHGELINNDSLAKSVYNQMKKESK